MMAWYAPNAAAGSDGSGRPISEVGPGIPSEDGYKERYEELMGIPPPPLRILRAVAVASVLN